MTQPEGWYNRKEREEHKALVRARDKGRAGLMAEQIAKLQEGDES
jgi:hypothetical protein